MKYYTCFDVGCNSSRIPITLKNTKRAPKCSSCGEFMEREHAVKWYYDVRIRFVGADIKAGGRLEAYSKLDEMFKKQGVQLNAKDVKALEPYRRHLKSIGETK